MSPVEFETDVTGATRMAATAAGGIPEGLTKILKNWGAESVKFLIRYSDSVFSKGKNRRTGHLRRNIAFAMAANAARGTVRIEVGTGVGTAKEVIYARIQDQGGTITPKKSKYLAVPLQPGLGSPRNYPDLFPIRTKSGNLLLVAAQWRKVRGGENSRRTGGLIPFFVLKKSVTLTGTLWFTAPMERQEQVLKGRLTPAAILAAAGVDNASD